MFRRSVAASSCLLMLVCPGIAFAQAGDPAALLEFKFTPAPRAQIAVWLENDAGRFLRTLALTEAVAYRGIGNRPGASEMNSGYRWPYGRREGTLPVWASRRAAAPGARSFRRVIFQDRREGLASRTTTDQSIDDYFCLSFEKSTTTRDALDAVSCASVFASDKGRFMSDADLAAGYAEPWQDVVTGAGSLRALSLLSPYPPRMDAVRCPGDNACYDHADLAHFAEHARAVMPEIDAVTMATPPGGVEQSWLTSIPEGWPAGSYVAWLEVNVEGDYNATFNASTYPTPTTPADYWDSWAVSYGYPYRGQPSVTYRIPFELRDPGEQVHGVDAPEGRSSWDVWAADYGALEEMSGMTDDPQGAQGSGADRMRSLAGRARVTLVAQTLAEFAEPEPGTDPWANLPMAEVAPRPQEPTPTAQEPEHEATDSDAGPTDEDDPESESPAVDESADGETVEPGDEGRGVILDGSDTEIEGPVGPIRGLVVAHHPNRLHAHEWVKISFRAPQAERELHRYEVRVATEPIDDVASFIRNGRPAKTATTDAEGAVMLMLPVDAAEGELVDGEVGNLVASTRHWIAVRAVDRLNRLGPISVAEIDTREREFATVSPCVIATAAYGTPLSPQISVLRRVRDRYLMSHAPGRVAVSLYYRYGPVAARWVAGDSGLRALVRRALDPLVRVARGLDL